MTESLTRMTFVRLLLEKKGVSRDLPEARHSRQTPWSQSCEHDVISADDEPIWIGDAIAEWLARQLEEVPDAP